MGALFHRERTGEATTVDVSLLGAGLWSMGAGLALSLQMDIPWAPPPKGGSPSGNPLVGNYRTQDGRYVALCCLQPGKYWAEAVTLIGVPELADDERFVDAPTILANGNEGYELLAAAFAERPLDEWRERLADFSGQWAIVQNTLEAAADPQSVANGYVERLRDRRRRPVPPGHRTRPVRRRARPGPAGTGVQRARRRHPRGPRLRLGHDRGSQGPRRRGLRPGPTSVSTWGDAAHLVDILDVRPEGDGRFVSVARASEARPVVEGSQMLGQAIVAASRRRRSAGGVGLDGVPPGGRRRSAPDLRPRRAERRPHVHDHGGVGAPGRPSPGERDRPARRDDARRHPPRRATAAGRRAGRQRALRHGRHRPGGPRRRRRVHRRPRRPGRSRRCSTPGSASPTCPRTRRSTSACWPSSPATCRSPPPSAPTPASARMPAHRTLSTAINAIALSVHADVHADRWMRYHHHSTFAGDGMTHAECRVYDEPGDLLASFTVDAMVRPFADPAPPSTSGRRCEPADRPPLDVPPTPGAPVRPLPQLTPANEWFWTSGADGRLRIQQCDDCRALVHPPTPICPVCRSRAWTPAEVSGTGTVIGLTVNHHPWHPDFEPPYVIANVVLAEDADRAPHHQHRRLRARRGPHRPGGPGPLRAATRTCGSRSSSRPAATTRPTPSPSRSGRRRGPRVSTDRFEHRRRAVGGRPLGHRTAPDAGPAVAHRGRLPRRGRPTPGSPSTTSTACRPTPGPAPDGDERGRGDRRRGGPAPPADLDQRRRRPARARRARSSPPCWR